MRRHSIPLLSLGLVLGAAACSQPAEGASEPTEAIQPVDTELVAAKRLDVIATTSVEANVGNGALVTLPIQQEGIVTWAPAQGTTLETGDVIVEVGARPVVLVVGQAPMYRPLRVVARGERDEAGTRVPALTGFDVAQLQQFLLDEGFDDKALNGTARLTVDATFGVSTQRAVKDWQKSVGHPMTGVIDSSQMVFTTSEVLVESNLAVGQPFEQFDVTGTTTVLSLTTSTINREFFPVGAVIDVQSDPPLTGTVTKSSRISGDGGISQYIEILIDDVRPDALGESVEVVGSVVRAEDALTIPVRALLAVASGGWVVEVESGPGTERVPVELVEVVDTTAIITGIEEGDEVVVPL